MSKPGSHNSGFPVTTYLGSFYCEFTRKGISRILFPGIIAGSPRGADKRVPCPFDRVSFQKDLRRYLAGEKTPLKYPLDLSDSTDFQRSVWSALRKIPYGTTVTYEDLCRLAGKGDSFRAAGNACGKNPVPVIIPCHRVIRKDGGLGGFSAGIKWKQRLLAIESSRAAKKLP